MLHTSELCFDNALQVHTNRVITLLTDSDNKQRDHVLKHLKPLHALFGVLALALTLAIANDLIQLTELSTDFNTPIILILLATSLCNLCFSVSRFSSRRGFEELSSLLVLGSVVLTAIPLYRANIELGGYDPQLIGIISLIAGVILHFVLNLTNTPSSSNVSVDNSDRETGTVKWFNVTKGFGFITRDAGDDVFVHYRAIRGEGHRILSEGQRVEFVVVDKDKGLQAEDVIAAPRGR